MPDIEITFAATPWDRLVPLLNGEAIYSGLPPSKGPLADRSRFEPLFEDDRAEAERNFSKTSIFPAHHAPSSARACWTRRQREVFGDDPYAYGVKANAAMVELVQSFAWQDGMTPRKLAFSDLFAKAILDS